LYFVNSLACNAVTGLPDGGIPQDEDAPDAFSAQLSNFSAESSADGRVLLKWEPISDTIVKACNSLIVYHSIRLRPDCRQYPG
jgi:hypothetical protein